ncbi:MAG: hypothetical protein K2O47_04030, partial [Muribaculaceae bacterium]|nr:hypothetical protein [Muribaculaceae bacterium]
MTSLSFIEKHRRFTLSVFNLSRPTQLPERPVASSLLCEPIQKRYPSSSVVFFHHSIEKSSLPNI